MPDPANYIFLPWVQPATAANMPPTATDKLTANQPGVVALPVKVVINADSVTKNVRLYGPGEITGIDLQQVVRTEPRHLTPDFEPNYFPAIEFDRPDFPWLFTPAKADAQGRLRPWLCLVVVRKQEGVALRPAVTTPLPTLEINPPAKPADELPDLSESWAWAHAQVTGSERSKLKETLANAPARSVARLLCPRRLDPNTEYIACVVPTFELGRKAGLNLPIQTTDEARLDPAWVLNKQPPEPIQLPVYYHWAFRTGDGADFEELVRRLEPRTMPPGVGKRPLDISRPGFKLPPDTPSTVLGLEGALRVVQTKPDDWPDQSRLPLQTELKRLLNTPAQMAAQGGDQDPVLGPPIYGRWQAAVAEVGQTTPPTPAPPAAWPPPFWLDELNLDPRHRVVAGAGTVVIQREQEALMTSAWAQLGDIEKINQRLRQAQLSRAVNNVYHVKVFSRLPEETFMKMVAPAQSRIFLEERPQGLAPTAPPVKTLLAQKLAGSAVPRNTVSAPMRRLTRPRGAINRQFIQAGTTGVVAMVRMFNQASDPNVVRTSPPLGEFVWVEDTPPAGAQFGGDEPWTWVSANPAPYTGSRCHQSTINPGTHQHFFHSVSAPLDIGVGDKLFAYIFVDPANVPSEVMLQWHTEGNWEHRAYWGNNNIAWGVDGTTSRRRVGSVPGTGGWVRLEVAAADVGLEGRAVDGMAFSLFGGRATWDRAGKLSPHHKGPITLDRVSDMLPAGGGFVFITDPPAHWERARAAHIQMRSRFRPATLAPTYTPAQPVAPEFKSFVDAVTTHHNYLSQTFGISNFFIFATAFFVAKARIVPQDIKAATLLSLSPDKTIGARALANFNLNSPPLRTGDPLDPVMDAPAFPQPMYEALRDVSPEFLFPGLEQVPPDSVQLLETNAQFIESFMVGLNAEMSRELLWRGYPTDQRGTYFQHFWDTLDDTAQLPPDIPPIHLWGKRKLGANTTGAAAGNKLVLLIRGELLRRYPNTVIYAVTAVRNGPQLNFPPDPVTELHPVFRGTLEPDVTFLGFDLTATDARTDPGLFFVLQQQPTEPRFGLDAAPFSAQANKPEKLPELQTWNDLNWGHLAKDAADLQALAHVALGKVKLAPTLSDSGLWARNAAHMAYITKQLPVRIAIHSSQLLSPA